MPLPLLIPLLIQGVAADTFAPNCTRPTEITKIVSGPNVRSTWDILWSCLLTIFLCVWTVRHPGIEEIARFPGDSKWTRWRDVVFINSMTTFMSLCAPELELSEAMSQCLEAYRWSRCDALISAAERSGGKWTLTHAYLVGMRGYFVKEPDSDERTEIGETSQLLSERDGDTDEGKANPFSDVRLSDGAKSSVHQPAESTIKRKPVERSELTIESQSSGKNCVFLHEEEAATGDAPPNDSLKAQMSATPLTRSNLEASQLCYLARKNLIPDFPAITEEEIQDKSKENVLMKLIPMGQIIWLIIQLSVRKANGLPSTQLEIATLSFGVCTLLTYAFWLYKPKDINQPFTVRLARPLTQLERTQLYSLGWNSNKLESKGIHGQYIRIWPFKQKVPVSDLGLLMGGVVFGAIHCAAWNYEFRTAGDQKLWRISSIVTVALLPAFFILYAFLGEHLLGNIWMMVVTLAYGAFRIIIMILTFRSLFHSPPGVFEATWTSSFPHLG